MREFVERLGWPGSWCLTAERLKAADEGNSNRAAQSAR